MYGDCDSEQIINFMYSTAIYHAMPKEIFIFYDSTTPSTFIRHTCECLTSSRSRSLALLFYLCRFCAPHFYNNQGHRLRRRCRILETAIE